MRRTIEAILPLRGPDAADYLHDRGAAGWELTMKRRDAIIDELRRVREISARRTTSMSPESRPRSVNTKPRIPLGTKLPRSRSVVRSQRSLGKRTEAHASVAVPNPVRCPDPRNPRLRSLPTRIQIGRTFSATTSTTRRRRSSRTSAGRRSATSRGRATAGIWRSRALSRWWKSCSSAAGVRAVSHLATVFDQMDASVV